LNKKILIVDDELSMREFLEILLCGEGYNVDSATNGTEAIKKLKNNHYQLIISDIQMPGMDGLELLKNIKDLSPTTEVLMMTAYASTETAVEAMKSGAYDYITKPFKVDEVKLIIKNVLEKVSLKIENILLKQELKEEYRFGDIIGVSSSMRDIYDLIMQIAPTKTNILIEGESGTGKELVAKSIHANSNRKDNSLITVNCGAVPENLLESELFGHIKGAFTGAIANKQGLFELANGGTIFLDEIGEMPIQLQVKILRVIQEKEFRRVGDIKASLTDIRIIAATNKDLEEAIKQGSFREDLYYRLNVIQIKLPPLRERKDDIPSLASSFLKKYNNEIGKDIKHISSEALELLLHYEFPGNIRELENIIERAVALEKNDVILPESLPAKVRKPSEMIPCIGMEIPTNGLNMEGVMDEMEKGLLMQALQMSEGGKTKAARLLNLSFRSFRYRLKKYKLDNEP